MVQDGVTWFGAEAPTCSSPSRRRALPNAVFVRQTVPAPMIAGQRYAVSVTMRNTGMTTWTAAEAQFRLGAINPDDNTNWGTNRVGLGCRREHLPRIRRRRSA